MRCLLKILTAGRLLVLEAAVLLLAARVALKLLPFRRLRWYLARGVKQPEVQGEQRKRLKNKIYSAVCEACYRLPGEMVCFPKAIAAQTMLRRRGVGIRLVYGAARNPDTGLVGHVWPQDGNDEPVDFRFTQGCHPLAHFPDK